MGNRIKNPGDEREKECEDGCCADLDAEEKEQSDDQQRLQAKRWSKAEDEATGDAGSDLVGAGIGIEQFQKREDLLEQKCHRTSVYLTRIKG